MTTEKTRVPLAQAEEVASRLVAIMSPVCERIEIAGSMRRRRGMVGDIEICMISAIEERAVGLFGESEGISMQYEHAKLLRAEGVLVDRLDVRGCACFGPHYQRVLYDGVAADIFVFEAAQWGVGFAIRTGSADFSKRLVTPRAYGGYLQAGQQCKGWRLWDRGRIIETREETDFFNAIGLDWVCPEDRL